MTDDLLKTYQAGKIVGAVAKQLGGGGGGKPQLATAGALPTGRIGAKPKNAICPPCVWPESTRSIGIFKKITIVL